jgi:hypothetical protein
VIFEQELFLILTSASYFFLAGCFSLAPPVMQRVFGSVNGAQIYGFIFSAFAMAAIGGSMFVKVLSF